MESPNLLGRGPPPSKGGAVDMSEKAVKARLLGGGAPAQSSNLISGYSTTIFEVTHAYRIKTATS